MQFIMQYGEQALKALEQMMNDPKNEAQSEMLEQLLKDGMLDKDGKGKLRLTPRAVFRSRAPAAIPSGQWRKAVASSRSTGCADSRSS